MQSKLCVRECRWSLILFKESTSPECVCRAYAGLALAPNVVSTPCAGPGPRECMREAETACATRMHTHTHTHPRNEHPLCLAVDAHAARRRRATPRPHGLATCRRQEPLTAEASDSGIELTFKERKVTRRISRSVTIKGSSDILGKS